MIIRRKAMMVPRGCLIVGVTGGDLDHAPVRHGHRLEKPQRTAVPRGEELHGNVVPGVGAFGPVSPIPLCARAVAEPIVITHSVVEPSGFLTATTSDPWGFVNCIFSTDPDSS